MHKEWYDWSEIYKKYVKIIPLDIGEQLTEISLAHWIMGDGYWDKNNNTMIICTDCFTLEEVSLLVNVLKNKFDLNCSLLRRIKSNKEICWRIRFSSKFENIEKLKNLVKPYFIPSMLYKLNI